MGGKEVVSVRRAIGIGCSSDASVDDIVELVHRSIRDFNGGAVLATLDRRAAIAHAVASILGCGVVLFPAEVLAQTSGISTSSTLAAESVGTRSVAEASALAALGPAARLVLERRRGRHCTCAVAELP